MTKPAAARKAAATAGRKPAAAPQKKGGKPVYNTTLRQNGCFMPKEAEYAIFETTGKISVRRRGRAGHCAPNNAPLAG